jgi:hypothetical protein
VIFTSNQCYMTTTLVYFRYQHEISVRFFFLSEKKFPYVLLLKKPNVNMCASFQEISKRYSILSEKKLPYTCRKTKSKCLHLCKKFLRYFFFLLGKKLSYGLRLEKPNLKYLFERNFQIFCFVLNKTFIDHMVLVLEKRYTL